MNTINLYMGQTFRIHQLINIQQVVSLISLSRLTIYSMKDKKSASCDPNFLKHIQVLKNCVCWSIGEINQ
ncbi:MULTISPECIES: AlpA family phage regulatory protein [Acinetobacter]|nr:MULTISPECIES: AlpA family phage regulatory protein [Acinetobacter]MDQ8861545.1 AlpA family phage regulatory protein [Acinetobacter nosocomialis]MDQ8979284.1 AlpA family phage regulatory protein [Acinetobacter nosocomialis]